MREPPHAAHPRDGVIEAQETQIKGRWPPRRLLFPRPRFDENGPCKDRQNITHGEPKRGI